MVEEQAPEMDWKLSWELTDGKNEEYVFSDRGPAMRGFNETMISHGKDLWWIKLEQVTRR